MKLSCYLIGEDSLLIQCGSILLAKNHSIDLVITPIKSIQIWAKNNSIPYISALNELTHRDEGAVDIIFSIVNSYKLSPELVKMAKIGVFNYHDSILPHYAGLNATIWALVHNERHHGITWHLVNEDIDKGDIVNQRIVPIQTKETALTLNLRCYEEAIQGFKELVTGIETNSLSYQKQATDSGSTYHMRSVLPDLGFINWKTTSADCIERFSRALSLEYYNNPVGQLKLALPNNYLIVSQIQIIPHGNPLRCPSGMVLAMEEEALIIAVGSEAIRIGSFSLPSGKTISPLELERLYQIGRGYQCPYLEQKALEEVAPFMQSALKAEKFWTQKLQHMQEHSNFSAVLWKKDRPLQLAGRLCLKPPNGNPRLVLLTALLIYLHRLNNYQETSVFLIHENPELTACNLAYLFSLQLPLVLALGDWTFNQALSAVEKHLTLMQSKGNYLADIFARYPALSKLNFTGSISISYEAAAEHLTENSLVHFEIDAKAGEIRIYDRLDAGSAPGLSALTANAPTHLQALILAMAEDPDEKIADFSFLSDKEEQVLSVWSQGERVELPGDVITTLFDELVARLPEKPAIYFQEEVVSYRQLQTQAGWVAAYIQALGLPDQSLIGIFLPRQPQMLAVLLGILKAGCVFVPLDTKCPLLKLKSIVEEASLQHCISTQDQTAALQEQLGLDQMHSIETIWSEQRQWAEPAAKSSAELAYVMFTSGTTGKPKGVQVSQQNVINYCYWFAKTNAFGRDSIIDFSSSLAFDLSIPCTLAALLAGGSLAIAQEFQKLDPQLYLQYVQDYQITHVEWTPSYLRILLQFPEDIKKQECLRYLLLGADEARGEDIAKWVSLSPNQQIVNEYGPTETTVSVTSYHLSSNDLNRQNKIPIGKPGYNSSCYVLDAQNNLCPIGMKGELYIGGNQVSAGYLNNPDLSLSQFLSLELHGKKQRVYKTGDLVCWLPDGNLKFFGRNDKQVKIRGYRIELSAIESVLTRCQGIHQAIVVVRQGPLNEKYLRAYCVSHKHHLSLQAIKDFLSLELPAYMHPKEFFMLDAIPLMENEKIDYAALEKRAQAIQLGHQALLDHRESETEAICRSIWQEAFQLQGIGLDDDFFSLGGDSLIALQIVSALKERYQKKLPLSLLVEFPTIRALAAKIDSLSQEELSNSLTLIKLCEGRESIPLFLVHPLGGSVFWYQQLAQLLDGKYTIYGIQDSNFDGSGPRFNSLEAMAAYYLTEIAKIYSGDRYCLGGASFGATVAFAMADQLLQSGKKIEFLGLFDGWAHYPSSIMQAETNELLLVKDEDFYKKVVRDTLKEQENYRKQLLLQYQLPRLKTDITLFKAKELWGPFSAINDEYNGWRPYVDGQIRLVLTPGTHETMFHFPQVRAWADLI